MDIRKIKKLIELLEESGVAEIEIKEGEESVRIARQSPAGSHAHPVATPITHSPPAAARRPAAGSTRTAANQSPAADETPGAPVAGEGKPRVWRNWLSAYSL